MKKRPKKNIIYAFLIVILVFLSILLSNKSYTLKGYQGLEHKETIATSYRVYLDDDSYFNTAYLEEDMQYISSIIDYVDVTFSYIDSFKDNLTYDVKTKAEAKGALEKIQCFLAKNLELELNEKTQIFKSRQGVNFCGYKINPYRLKIRDRGKRKLKKKVKELKYKIRTGELDSKDAKKYLCGHFGYIKYANVKNLAEKLFEV